ncbi:hypothetical protein L1887_55343 [Cichorium endivia]|nr:hypothetical protein L1887_55343 [Cichorium endivia]
MMPWTTPNPETLRLDEADRSWIETQARVVVGLAHALTAAGRQCDAFALPCTEARPTADRDGLELYEETEEVRLVENTEGERYVELRKIKIKVARPGHAGAAAREENEGGAAGGAAAGANTPPPDDDDWGAGADMTPPPPNNPRDARRRCGTGIHPSATATIEPLASANVRHCVL